MDKPKQMPINPDQIPEDLIKRKQWVVWRWEYRNKNWTKPPYQVNSKSADSTDAETWNNFEDVVNAYHKNGWDGIGFVFQKDDPYAGVDWDDCRDPETGEIDPRFAQAILKFDSYTETSPSGTGYKTLIQGKLPKGGHKKGQLETYDHGRYFTITGWRFDKVSSRIEPRQDALNELIRQHWPGDFETEQKEIQPSYPSVEISDPQVIEKALQAKDGGKFASLWNGDAGGYVSSSEADLALCAKLAFWVGKDADRIDRLFRQSGMMRDKWLREDYRTKTLEKAISQVKEVYSEKKASIGYVEELNKKHAVVMIGGKCAVMNEYIEPVFNRQDINFSTVPDFKHRYSNRKVLVPDKNGKLVQQPLGSVWMDAPQRRQYEGIVFDPGRTPDKYYNLWKGFTVTPKKGDWYLFRDHIYEVICNADVEYCDWLLCWMAKIVQDPGGTRPGTAVVLRGTQGTGKGAFAVNFGQIAGNHFLHLTQQEHLTGRFNFHLKDGLIVFVDEGFWAGDKRAEGAIKGMITEDVTLMEGKFKDPVAIKNRVSLILASNSEWVVPAGFDERRFFVLDVSSKRKGDRKYFNRLYHLMDNGGREAMVYDLLHEYDPTAVDLRTIPRTEGLLDQIRKSMDGVQSFWFDCLQNETVGDEGWPESMEIGKLWGCYIEYAKNVGIRHRESKEVFGKELRKMCPGTRRIRPWPAEKGVRPYHYSFPYLEQARKDFERVLGQSVDWEDDDDE